MHERYHRSQFSRFLMPAYTSHTFDRLFNKNFEEMKLCC